MKSHLLALVLPLLVFPICALTQISAAQETPAQQKPAAQVFTKDTTVYVSDFDLDAQNVAVDTGGPGSQVRPGIIERPRKREQQDPEAQAKKLVNVMSTSLVADLQKAGYKAVRLAPGEANPTTGAWVHGVFTEVDEGNRMRRAIIGFGSGQVSMNLYVTLTDLASPEKPLYNESKADTSAGKMGAVIAMNPYVAAAKFVMEKNAPEKTVKKTASEVAAAVETQLKQYGDVPTSK